METYEKMEVAYSSLDLLSRTFKGKIIVEGSSTYYNLKVYSCLLHT
jgi:hypothetical protein